MRARTAHRRCWLHAAALAVLLACEAASAQPRPSAREVEAAYLINFLRYTQWPAQSFETAQSPYVIGVAGSEDATAIVRAVAQAAGTVNGRPIEVRAVRAARASSAGADHAEDAHRGNRWSGLHLVFFHASGGAPSQEELASLAGNPILTVSDAPGFIAAGGMIELIDANEHIVFAANPTAIASAQLVVSSKVLKLARLTGTSAP